MVTRQKPRWNNPVNMSWGDWNEEDSDEEEDLEDEAPADYKAAIKNEMLCIRGLITEEFANKYLQGVDGPWGIQVLKRLKHL